jgi:hypothetical protein
MTQENKTVHYEDLWMNAEKLAQSLYQTTTNTELFDKIKNILTAITEVDSSKIPNDAKSEMKRRFIGEVLFLLTAFSAKEDIDVYGALKDQLFANVLITNQR